MIRHMAAAIALTIASALPASAATELLTNGGFETGDFTGWTPIVASGSNGTIEVITSAVAPISGNTTTGLNEGSSHALTGQGGPGAQGVIQNFTVPVGVTSLDLSFDMFAVSDVDFVDGGLDFTGAPTQNARVDILSSAANDFDTGAGVVWQVLFPFIDGPFSGAAYTSYTEDLLGLLTPGESYQLRFAEADNQFFLSMGVDSVSLEAAATAAVPLPASLALMLTGLGALSVVRRRVG